jgi:glutamyl-tRNA synthetase/nondiscriminating glutamyl-tRNA synthetase
MKEVRVRYAPSPTGLLHIGNARTAIFNYLYARHYGGSFIIRIEDTDVKRNVEGGEESQLNYLKWLGLTWDESDDVGGKYGPYHQLQRLDLYKEYTDKLLDMGLAYKEANEDGSGFGIRFRVPKDKTYSWNDLVRGNIKYESNEVEDWIIMKDNGIPTYNFAVVVDDHLMNISHILRGEEHITNTPKQIMVYEAFDWEVPKFGHMTIIVNEQGKKLSKRDANVEQFISQYAEKGYLPSSLFNFISLLGWSSPNNKEILSQEEIINLFESKRLTSAPSFFDKNKLNFLNSKHIKLMEFDKLVEFIRPFVIKGGIEIKSDYWLRQLVTIFKDRLVYGEQIVDLYKEFVEKEFDLTPEYMNLLKEYDSLPLIEDFYKEIVILDEINQEEIDKIINKLQTTLEIKGKALYIPLRICSTCEEHGPNLSVILELLGKERVLENILKTLDTLRG